MSIEGEPAQLAERPHHGRFPIPFVTAIVDGLPDFRSHDHERRRECAEGGLCQLCGRTIATPVFVGFPWALQTHRFGEPPMHTACMEFAWKACPWLAAGSEWRVLAGSQFADRPPTTPEAMVVVWAEWVNVRWVRDDSHAARGKDVLLWRVSSFDRFELRQRGGH